MLTKMPHEFRKFSRNCHTLRRILKDTQRALDDITSNLLSGIEVEEQLPLSQELVNTLRTILERSPVVLVFGQNCHAKSIFINTILDQAILPFNSSRWKWVRFLYGQSKSIRLTLGCDFEIVEKLKAHEQQWTTIPEEDLQRTQGESLTEHCPTLEIELHNPILRDNNIIIPPDCSSDELSDVLLKNLDNVLPVIMYVVIEEVLSDTDIQEIRKLKEIYQDPPILFVSVTDNCNSLSTESLTESDRHLLEQSVREQVLKKHHGADGNHKINTLRSQLLRLGYLNETDTLQSNLTETFCTECSVENSLISDIDVNEKLVIFVQGVLKSYLLKMSAWLIEIHSNCLRWFILSAFDMAREIQITPRRILYAQAREAELYKSLIKIAGEKQEEITKIIQATLHDMKSNVAEVLEGYHHKVEDHSNLQQQSSKLATMEIQQLVLRKLSSSVGRQLVQSVGCLHESFTGTLQRCLESLEKNCHELEGNLLASDAVKQILSAAYNIDLKSSTSFSIVHTFMDRLRKLIHNFQFPWSTSAQQELDFQWQLQIATDMIDSLSASKLARTISTQFQEHVKSSHEAFQSAMRSLENQLSGKLEQTEEQRIAIRKRHAPRFARLTLESTSLCDLVRWGMPVQTKEIGRGQYGVVFAAEPWGGVDPCAVKSIVPPDDRHWNDLAMEFYYTRIIPEHARIVKIRGSVIDHTYSSGCSSAVLLVMEHMTRDLYCGLKAGLSWSCRLQIAIDVVEGIRYLHSQGLVHRDIKLKNVLLDSENRAKLTDFGFCIPEAMMSGSIVGTPVHMAPELLSGQYDSSVDVYAFGILFWYICAGQVRLPYVFEQFQNKEQLWTSVRKGIRPECLPHFSEACWNLMEQCWAAEPSARPLLGYVQPQLEAIQRNAVKETVSGKSQRHKYSRDPKTLYRPDPDYYCYNNDFIFVREF